MNIEVVGAKLLKSDDKFWTVQLILSNGGTFNHSFKAPEGISFDQAQLTLDIEGKLIITEKKM